MLQNYPVALESYIEKEIHEVLQQTIFRRSTEYLGLRGGERRFIADATHSLTKLDPPRGNSPPYATLGNTDRSQISKLSISGTRKL